MPAKAYYVTLSSEERSRLEGIVGRGKSAARAITVVVSSILRTFGSGSWSPAGDESLARGVGVAHQRHAQQFSRRHRLTGHLFEGRFFSTPLDERHTQAAALGRDQPLSVYAPRTLR